MIITLSGNVASGKSTIGDALAEKLGFKRYSSGNFMRAMAKKKGVTLQKLGKEAEKTIMIDKEIDDMIIKLSKKEDNFIIDSRLAWYFIPHSFKIYLHVGKKEQVRRMKLDLSNKKRGEEEIKNDKDILEKIKEREESEKERYMKYYGIDYHQKKFYDLWLKTDELTIDTCAEEIKKVLKKQKLL
ncbi:AAA family ATPase [Candidatus Woesearchaeota archaeon]|jgi:CMP/dCMP kinase|nr:AAA family ATPase [Candidatus Woesearchaeota archaeon]MBT5272051.1 AAA family ATPase [Candidatus Woesearchaeota archaeon]MBT6041801.1 AAA family ATPase [Candidatus Woesearchaeota archaeon]MBT6336824.1 AAA family ATPase [Candidatus Woesearchaeota archaeon]MBT7927641.1 AAA family ATPase [Candidatus Woesearchaeota archaeon]